MSNTDTPLWYSSHESLVNLAQHLLDAGELQTGEDMLAYFEKPWKWQAEWDSYQEDQQPETNWIQEEPTGPDVEKVVWVKAHVRKVR